MLALTVETSEVRAFMNRILVSDIFDALQVRVVELSSAINFSIDAGGIAWEALKPTILAIIKAGHKPVRLKIVFSYHAAEVADIHTNAQALFLNLAYESDAITLTTATAQREFALDKSLDIAWDEWVLNFFAEKSVAVSEKEI